MGRDNGLVLASSPFEARDHMGRDNGLVLLFIRSADWCPFRKTEPGELKQEKLNVARRGLSGGPEP